MIYEDVNYAKSWETKEDYIRARCIQEEISS
jgi:hypothetical protein